jgi:hypothetical protein
LAIEKIKGEKNNLISSNENVNMILNNIIDEFANFILSE